jgi:hypothetical protein
MERRCAWCGGNLGRKEPFDDDRRTDGICPACAEEQFGQELESSRVTTRKADGWAMMLLEVRAVAHTIEERIGQTLAQQ